MATGVLRGSRLFEANAEAAASMGEEARLAVIGEFGEELELEKLSSNLDSERQVETDLAEPELTEPVPEKRIA